MKLVIAIVQDEYGALLTETLIREGFSATKLASTGGFFRAGNTTFLIGVATNQMDKVLEIIRTLCPAGKTGKGGPAAGDGANKSPAANPLGHLPAERAMGGATVFVMGVEKMVKC